MVEALSAGAAVAAGTGGAGGITEAVKSAVVDAYGASKKALRGRFGDDEDAKEKLGQLEIKPDDPGIQEALTGYVKRYRAAEDPGVAEAVEALRVQLARVEGGIGSIRTGDITDNTLTADRGGVVGVNITGGVTAGYTQPSRTTSTAPSTGRGCDQDPH